MKNDVCTAELATEIAALKSKVFELEALVKYYEEQFRLAKHRQFGVSSEKSEYDFGQLCLFNEADVSSQVNCTVFRQRMHTFSVPFFSP